MNSNYNVPSLYVHKARPIDQVIPVITNLSAIGCLIPMSRHPEWTLLRHLFPFKHFFIDIQHTQMSVREPGLGGKGTPQAI